MKRIEKKASKIEKKTQDIQSEQQNFVIKNQYESNIYDYCRLGTETDQVVQNGINIVTLTNNFAERAKAKVIEIIDELFLPKNIRLNRFSNISFSSSSLDGEIPNKIIFKDEFLTISVALPEQAEKVQLLEHGLETMIVEENSVFNFYPAQGTSVGIFRTRDNERLPDGPRQAVDEQAGGGAFVHGDLQRSASMTKVSTAL